MTWSYSGNPSVSEKDQVRFLVQDTQSAKPLLQDEEIAYLISTEGSPQDAAAKAAETLAAQFARFVDESVGQVKVSFSQRFKHYSELAKNLKRQASIKNAEPFAGALDESQKNVQEEDDDRIKPFFTRDQDDYLPRRREEGRAISEEDPP